jgi:23S rRNA A1618 N6-methylase RlmF
MENQDHFAGKTVLHITEGINCLYSIFAARAGATKVYCVILEKGEREKQSVQMMKQIIKENRLQDTIEVLLWKDFNANIDAIIA